MGSRSLLYEVEFVTDSELIVACVVEMNEVDVSKVITKFPVQSGLSPTFGVTQ